MAPRACPSCGARAVQRKGRALRCTFCGSAVQPRLEPGTLCGDGAGDRPCSHLAVSLCDGCGVPLCDRHNDPKTHYWAEPLQAKSLCPGWDARDLRDWSQELQFRLQVPVPGFDPCPVTPRREEALRAAGDVEERLRERVRHLARERRGDLVESGCVYPDHCSACFTESQRAVDETVAAGREAVFQTGISGVLDAFLAETEEALHYVEAFPGASFGGGPGGKDPWDEEYPLDAAGPPEVWGRYWERLRARRATLRRLAERAGREPA